MLFFFIGIGKPANLYYDEPLYVREARGFLHGEIDAETRMHNSARPPFGKMLLGIGIKAAGDTPFGWRFASAICGALTLAAVYLWSFLLVRDTRIALFSAGVALLNNFLFVMSRVAMMDAFLVVFLMWSLVAYTASIVLDLSVAVRRFLVGCCGILMGLAGATKWNAIDTLAVLILVSLGLLWAARRSGSNNLAALSRPAQNIQKIGIPSLLLGLVVVPFAIYILTFWPLCRILGRPFDVATLLSVHSYMLQLSTHWATNPAITSAWYTWPLSLNPQRALSYLLANPIVSWGGLAAVIFCAGRFLKSVTFPEGLVVLLYVANFFQWAVTPEKGLMYYYYYPAVMMLGVAIAVALRNLPPTLFGVRVSLMVLVAAAAAFLWCYPRMAHLQVPWDCVLGCWN